MYNKPQSIFYMNTDNAHIHTNSSLTRLCYFDPLCIQRGFDILPLQSSSCDVVVFVRALLRPVLSAFRADSRFGPSQRETTLLCNDVSRWLGATVESALSIHIASPSLHPVLTVIYITSRAAVHRPICRVWLCYSQWILVYCDTYLHHSLGWMITWRVTEA